MPLKAPDPAQVQAQRIMHVAFEDLEQAISPSDSRDFSQVKLSHVRQAALDIESQLGARGLLRNMRRLDPLFRGLEHYAKVIEVLCNGTEYLPWLWAPIQLILKAWQPFPPFLWAFADISNQVSSDLMGAFERIMDAYSRIAESLVRFELLAQSFRGEPQALQTFAVFYADILRFHKEAYAFLRRSGWKVLFITSWGRFQRRFDHIIDNLRKHEELIDKEVNARNIVEARKMRQELQEWRQKSLATISKEQDEQASLQLQGIVTWLKLDDTQQIILHDSISTEALKYQETMDWILKNAKAASWLRPKSETPFLWLKGNPGTGKSIISARLVDFLTSAKSSVVIRYFCSYLHSTSTQYDEILKSILLQLVQHNEDLVAHIYDDYVGKKLVAIPVLEYLLRTSVEVISGGQQKGRAIHVILDGLDECPEETQRRLIVLADRLASVGHPCKMLISSRSSVFLQGKLRRKAIISLTDEKPCLEKAITSYATQRLLGIRTMLSQLGIGETDIGEIARRIGTKADGMFLWARLVLEYLMRNLVYTRDEFMAAIEELPHELAEFYGNMLTQILHNLDPRSVRRVTSILGWVAFARRPLRKIEFQSALLFGEETSDHSDYEKPVPAYIINACKPLIEERQDSTFVFIHVSVKEYLQLPISKIHVAKGAAQLHQGCAIFRCLESGLTVFHPKYPLNKRQLRVVRGIFAFLLYSSEYWVDCLLDLAKLPNDLAPSLEFWTIASRVSEQLSRLGRFDSDQGGLTSDISDLEPIRNLRGLHYNAQLVLQARLERKIPAETPQSRVLEDLENLGPVLSNYQVTIRSLLGVREYPAVTAEDMEMFKNNFRSSAFTCRLASCPRATLGFETEELRKRHEGNHQPQHRCPRDGCPYPPFPSSQSLRSHQLKYHTVPAIPVIKRTMGTRQLNSKGKGPRIWDDSTNEQPKHMTVPSRLDTSNEPGQLFTDAPLPLQQQDNQPPPPFSITSQLPQSTASPELSLDGPLKFAAGYSGSVINDLNPDAVPFCYKKTRDGWFLIYNPAVSRSIDVDLVHTRKQVKPVVSMCFSANGNYMAAGCDRSIHIYDIQTGEKICGLYMPSVNSIHGKWITSMCFSPDNKYIITGGDSTYIPVWDIQSQILCKLLYGHEQPVRHVDFAQDGQTIASSSEDKTIRLWDVETMRNKMILRIESGVGMVAICPSVKYLAAACGDNNVRLWNISNGQLVRNFGPPDGHESAVLSVEFAPNGNYLITSSLDKTIKMWDLQLRDRRGRRYSGPNSGRWCIKTFEGHKGPIYKATMTSDAGWVVSSSADKRVCFWDPQTGTSQLLVHGHDSPVYSVVTSPISNYFATSSSDGLIRIWTYKYPSVATGVPISWLVDLQTSELPPTKKYQNEEEFTQPFRGKEQ